MKKGNLSQWDQIREEIILLCVQWYISYPLTYSQLKTTMEKRGFYIDPHTINNLIHEYSSLAYKRSKETSNQRKGGWRVVQIPFKIKGRKRYLYRALNAQGNTLDFMISGSRSTQKAQNFFSESLSPDLQIRTKNLHKRKQIRRKSSWKLILGIIGVLFLFFSGSYALNRLEKQKSSTEDQSKKEVQLPNKIVQNATALDSLSPAEKAFLDTISWAEGTLNKNGYRILFGGEIVDDLSEHPEKCIPVRLQGRITCSSAFGRYQIMDFHAKNMSFEPENQDQWAIKKLEKIGALEKIKEGNIQEAISSSCRVWSSLPCHKHDTKGYYNQPIKSMEDLLNKYEKRLLLYK